MERHVSLDEISDGKLYTLHDMVKADCQDCEGCHACCQGMGASIVLDPMDIYRLSAGLKQSFEELLATSIELQVVDGVVLPNLKMAGETERCFYLNDAGRCSIHRHRPGICRLFPLGRVYEDNSFRYFLQIHECKKENRVKIKVKKWLDIPEAARYEQYINDWHYYIKDLQEKARILQNETAVKTISLSVLKDFYMTPYDMTTDFYSQFDSRLEANRQFLTGQLSIL